MFTIKRERETEKKTENGCKHTAAIRNIRHTWPIPMNRVSNEFFSFVLFARSFVTCCWHLCWYNLVQRRRRRRRRKKIILSYFAGAKVNWRQMDVFSFLFSSIIDFLVSLLSTNHRTKIAQQSFILHSSKDMQIDMMMELTCFYFFISWQLRKWKTFSSLCHINKCKATVILIQHPFINDQVRRRSLFFDSSKTMVLS